MQKFIALAALSLLIGTSAPSLLIETSASAQTQTNTKVKKPPKQAPVRLASPYSTNAEYDVYVRGEYVGSDPDPRIRSTIRREAVRNYGIR